MFQFYFIANSLPIEKVLPDKAASFAEQKIRAVLREKFMSVALKIQVRKARGRRALLRRFERKKGIQFKLRFE